MDAATAKDRAKSVAEERKYKLFLEECKAADLSDIEKLGLVSCQAVDILGRRIVRIALGLQKS